MLVGAGGAGGSAGFFSCRFAATDPLVVRWTYTMSNLGISLLVIPIGLLLIVGMVASLFLYVH